MQVMEDILDSETADECETRKQTQWSALEAIVGSGTAFEKAV